ncbi:MAG: ABC transporter permease [Flavobacteriales bacterium]|nr:MAG: ABC transporter permease [Flavobacteriales bacterium]
MKLPVFIARRYFFSRYSATAVNILAGISIAGLVVGTGALLVILAAFNGLEDLVKSFYASFDPDYKVEIKIGKNFPYQAEKYDELIHWDEIESVSQVLEERVLLRYREQEFIATARGVDSNYHRTTGIADAVYRGQYKTQHPDAVVGIGVAYNLGMSYVGRTETIEMFVPRASVKNLSRPDRAFHQDIVFPAGLFAVQPEFDVRYILTDLERLQRMSEQESTVSAIEIKVRDGVRASRIQEKLRDFFGDEFHVRNRIEQQAAFFKVMRAEGLITYLIFTFILLISSFTLLGSLSMMILDKKKDTHTLWFLGMPRSQLRQVFFAEGLLITFVGAVIGLALGGVFAFLQHYFGLVTMGAGYVVEAYPVRLNVLDVFKVLATVLVIGISISFLASRRV